MILINGQLRVFVFLTITAMAVILVLCIKLTRQVPHHKSNNGFIRKYGSYIYKVDHEISLKDNNLYFAGYNDSLIFLTSPISPDKILTCTPNLKNLREIELRIPETIKLAWRAMQVCVDHPNIYLIDRVTPRILSYNIENSEHIVIDPPKINYDLALPYMGNSLILRSFDLNSKSRILNKLNLSTNGIVKNSEAFIIQQDGIYSTDGSITLNNGNNTFTYVYYYRNEYIQYDSNLNVISTGRTIDTNTHAKIVVRESTNNLRSRLAKPPLIVNRIVCASEDLLYVNSNVIADNDTTSNNEKDFFIDIYDLKKSEYIGSSHLPEYKGKRLTRFIVIKNKIIALYSNFLVSYRLI